MDDTLAQHLQSWLREVLPEPVEVNGRIGEGQSRQVWAVTAGPGAAARDYVLRVDPGTGPVAGTSLDLEREACVYAALVDSGLPVPALHAVAPKGDALLLDRALGTDDLAGARPELTSAVTRDFMKQLARLHSLDVRALQLGSVTIPDGGPAHARDEISLWQGILDDRGGGLEGPSTRFALDWLSEAAPGFASGTALCHGDAGPGNFLHDHGRVTALLDWEFAHVGDPHDDLAWVAVRNYVLQRPMDMSEAYGAYQTASKRRIDPVLLEYYRVLVLTRMVISCDAAVAHAPAADDPSVFTHQILRPYLGRAIPEALAVAGCAHPELGAVRAAAMDLWSNSPTGQPLTGDVPPLETLAQYL